MNVTTDDKDRIWGDGCLRLFVSHTSTYKGDVADFKSWLHQFGMSAFVAHEDIEPTRKWQDEIRRALFSMDILVALLTDDFKNSGWTDQEIGVAIGREIPVFSIRKGIDPYGFIGDRQAISGTDQPGQWASAVLGFALKNSDLSSQAVDAFICGVEKVENFARADFLFKSCLPKIDNLTQTQHSNLLAAFNENNQVLGAFQHNKLNNNKFNLPDMPEELRRITGVTHEYDQQNGRLVCHPF